MSLFLLHSEATKKYGVLFLFVLDGKREGYGRHAADIFSGLHTTDLTEPRKYSVSLGLF